MAAAGRQIFLHVPGLRVWVFFKRKGPYLRKYLLSSWGLNQIGLRWFTNLLLQTLPHFPQDGASNTLSYLAPKEKRAWLIIRALTAFRYEESNRLCSLRKCHSGATNQSALGSGLKQSSWKEEGLDTGCLFLCWVAPQDVLHVLSR